MHVFGSKQYQMQRDLHVCGFIDDINEGNIHQQPSPTMCDSKWIPLRKKLQRSSKLCLQRISHRERSQLRHGRTGMKPRVLPGRTKTMDTYKQCPNLKNLFLHHACNSVLATRCNVLLLHSGKAVSTVLPRGFVDFYS